MTGEGPNARVVHLADPDDLRLAGFGALVEGSRRRDADRDPETFVVESARAVGEFLDRQWPLRKVLLSSGRAAADPLTVERALAAGAEVYVVEQAVMDGLAGYAVHRGALALAERPPPRSVAELASGHRLVVVAEGINDLENLGALFRNAAAFGVGALVLDPSCADPFYRRCVRVSVGHVTRIPWARAVDWPGDLALLQGGGARVLALTPRAGAADLTLDELAGTSGPGDRWAVMVGSEAEGLSPAALAAADLRVRIPIADGVDSLNVATAAAIVLQRLSGFA